MFTQPRLRAVALLQFPSGLPLGIVWTAIPTWLAEQHVDLKLVGLVTLAQVPWTFKFLWAPLVDRYPLPFLGRRRGWIVVCQFLLLNLGLALAALSNRPDLLLLIGIVSLATAFVSATQDIAIDAHAVEVLKKDEQGAAVGARLAVYRFAMFVSQRISVTAAAWAGWPLVNAVLALLYLPAMWVTRSAPEPEERVEAPQTLRQAVWEPFVGMLQQHRAVEILAFVVLYKLSDNLTQALTGPFLVQMGFDAVDRGVVSGFIGLVAIVLGTVLGGLLTQSIGLGPALWFGGLVQIFSNLGYAAVAHVGPNRPLMYGATSFEYLASGLGNGAFGVLLLRLTQKRFSATQYALLSSLFSLPRVLAGPPAALLADAIGWRDFFVFTLVTGVPGLVMLYRFVPWGLKEPTFHVAAPATGPPLSRGAIAARSTVVGLVGAVSAALCSVTLDAIRAHRASRAFGWAEAAWRVAAPATLGDMVTFVGVLTVGVMAALTVAAGLVARRRAAVQDGGIAPRPVP